MAERAQIPIPEELLEQVERGNVLLFIGERLADTPGEPGVPDRLREALAERAGYAADSDLSFAELAQIYEDSHGRNALVQFMRDQLAALGDAPQPAHTLIASLAPCKVLVTGPGGVPGAALLRGSL